MSTPPDPRSPGWQGPPQNQPPAWGAAQPPQPSQGQPAQPYQGQPPQPYQGQSPQPYQGQPQQPYQGQPQPPYQGQPQQPYQGQQQPYQGQPPQQPYAGQQSYPPQTPSPKRRGPRAALLVLGGAVLLVVLGLVAWLVVVPKLQIGPNLDPAKINALYDPALGTLGNDATTTSTDPNVLFVPNASGCTSGMRTALARAMSARAISDTQTKGMGETGYVALYATVAQAKVAATDIDTSVLTCSTFSGSTSHLGSSPAYRDYTGKMTVTATGRSYTSVTLVQYGNAVAVTFVAGVTFAVDRADNLKTRMDSLR